MKDWLHAKEIGYLVSDARLGAIGDRVGLGTGLLQRLSERLKRQAAVREVDQAAVPAAGGGQAATFRPLRAEPPAPLFAGYLEQFGAHGQCQVDGRSPATRQITDNVWVCALAADQMALGNTSPIATDSDHPRPRVARQEVPGDAHLRLLRQLYRRSRETGWFGPEAHNGNLRRCWDISMPETLEQPLWNGCARRAINGYIPRFEGENAWESDKYAGLRDEADFDPQPGEPKTLNHLACEDQRLDEDGDAGSGWKP